MPIAAMDGLTAEHWSDVKSIIVEAVSTIKSPKFTTALVSDADESGVIQKRIVQNVYNADIVVCDVSGRNPNVLFELGMRLAFDKPTVIIKDEVTPFMFDTGVIEHVLYPRDLRFHRIVAFKEKLASKVAATYEAAKNDPSHSTFLKSFGTFKVAHLDQKEATAETVMLDMLTELQKEVRTLRQPRYVSAAHITDSDAPKNLAEALARAETILQSADVTSLAEVHALCQVLEVMSTSSGIPDDWRAKAGQRLKSLRAGLRIDSRGKQDAS